MSTGIPYGGAAQRWHDNPLQEEVDKLKRENERVLYALFQARRIVHPTHPQLYEDLDRLYGDLVNAKED
jgi:hypothetical protein